MMDLSKGIIKLFSQKIYLGMSYDNAKYVLSNYINNDLLSKSNKSYGYVSINTSNFLDIKTKDCLLFFSELKLKDVCFTLEPIFEKYSGAIDREQYNNAVIKSYENAIQYFANSLVPTKTISVDKYKTIYLFDVFSITIAVSRDCENATISVGKHYD